MEVASLPLAEPLSIDGSASEMMSTVAESIRTESRSREVGPNDEPRLRVMQVVLSLDPGGTERLVIEIVKTLAPRADFVVCCLDQAGSWASELVAEGVPVAVIGRRAGFHPGLGRAIARVAREHAIDVLHCHHYSPFVYGQIAALVDRGLRVVFTEHGRLSDARPSMKRRLVNPVLGWLPSAVFAVSDDLRRHMTAEGFSSPRVSVIHNGIDPGVRPTAADRAAARAELGIPADACLIGTAGRLDPVKDLDTLISAAAALDRSTRTVRLVVIGDGPERTALEQRAAALGLTDAVLFAGYRHNVRQLLAGVDVYVNSSIHEGVSLTILEAMAVAVPVVATRVGGTPEVVIDGETGTLVPARSPAALTAAIDQLARHPERRRTMGAAGRFRVKRHFSVDAMALSYYKAYQMASEG